MSEWEATNPVEITPTKDTILAGFTKLQREIPAIYSLLNRLRRLDAGAGQSVADAEAYAFRVDMTTNHLLIRNKSNTDWIDLGAIEENFGITAESIGAVEQKGNTGGFYFGNKSALPDPSDPEAMEGIKTNDLFLSMNEKKIYRWTGIAWDTWLSLNFEDMLNYEAYTIPRSEVAVSGKGKVLRLDPQTGKGNIDITGSPDQLFGKQIDVENLRDGDALVYNAEKNKIVNLPNGEKIGGKIRAVVYNIKDGQTLLYDAETNQFIPAYLQAVTKTATVAAALWSALPAPSGPYMYFYDIPDNSVEEETYVQISVEDEDQDVMFNAGLSPTCKTRSGFIRLYAVEIPTADMDIAYTVQPSRSPS